MEDFNDAGEQRSFDVIPSGTIVLLSMTVRPGGAGTGGWLKKSRDGLSEGLDCECTVIEGPYEKRKIWPLFTLGGTTNGHADAAKISRIKLRAILESARGIRPDDKSEQAAKARRTSSFADFDGLRFLAKTGVERRDGFAAKNTLQEIITPEREQWHAIPQVPLRSATPAKIERPAWARAATPFADDIPF
jgi:hypothetical protein